MTRRTPPPAPDKRTQRMRLLHEQGRPVPESLRFPKPERKSRAKAKATKEIKGGGDK